SPLQRRGFPPWVKKSPASKEAGSSKSGCETREVSSGRGFLVSRNWFPADRFVGDIAGAALDAVIDGDERSGAEGFVVIGGSAERSSQFFVELAHVNQLLGVRGKFPAVVG